jgi:hypothetical protein
MLPPDCGVVGKSHRDGDGDGNQIACLTGSVIKIPGRDASKGNKAGPQNRPFSLAS